MVERHRGIAGIEWRRLDVRDMVTALDDAAPDAGIADVSVDVAFDKSTLDAMVFGSPWNPPTEVKENTERYLKEVCLSFPRWGHG